MNKTNNNKTNKFLYLMNKTNNNKTSKFLYLMNKISNINFVCFVMILIISSCTKDIPTPTLEVLNIKAFVGSKDQDGYTEKDGKVDNVNNTISFTAFPPNPEHLASIRIVTNVPDGVTVSPGKEWDFGFYGKATQELTLNNSVTTATYTITIPPALVVLSATASVGTEGQDGYEESEGTINNQKISFAAFPTGTDLSEVNVVVEVLKGIDISPKFTSVAATGKRIVNGVNISLDTRKQDYDFSDGSTKEIVLSNGSTDNDVTYTLAIN